MGSNYAVVWTENGDAARPGKLELEARGLRLEGGGEVRELLFSDIAEIRIGRLPDERLAGRPALVVERLDGASIQIATVGEVGALLELAERIAGFQNGRAAAKRLVVVVPLKPGARDKVRGLLEHGPPFDPATAGLERHDVFLTEQEAVFLFDAPSSPRVVERLLTRPTLWRAAARWRPYLAGPPRLAEAIYSWERPTKAAAGF